ncbi:hypothetical protein ACFX14_034102 [Malus domestica]
MANPLCCEVTRDEIKDVCFSMNPNKAPGPNGFNGMFFQKSLAVISGDIICAVEEFFFSSGKLLKEFNTTIITLVPKVPNPSPMSDFRPISCCNTMYKIISMVLANRLKSILPHIISKSQTTFVHVRRIGDNILFVQELLRNHHRDKGSPRFALKVDLMKAYDMVEWDFILSSLAAFNFPPVMINWILCCISSPKFSIYVNGELTRFSASNRGLRQGDPLSPYLFVIAMRECCLFATLVCLSFQQSLICKIAPFLSSALRLELELGRTMSSILLVTIDEFVVSEKWYMIIIFSKNNRTNNWHVSLAIV